MIGWHQLRVAARPDPGTADLERLAKTLPGKRLRLGDVGRRFAWPRGGAVEAALVRAAGALAPDVLAQLADLLAEPVRSYVLRDGDGCERYCLIGSWHGGRVAWAEVAYAATAEREDCLHLHVHALRPDAPGLADDLQHLYAGIAPTHRPSTDFARRSLDRALWIGGSKGEARDAEWTHLVAGLLASRGLDVDIVTRPSDGPLEHTLKRVEGFKGRMTVMWTPHAGDGYVYTALKKVLGGHVVELKEPDLEMALLELAVELDRRDQERAEEQAGITGIPTPEPGPLTGGPHYFKKVAAGGGGTGDVMTQMRDPCVHNSWRRARGGEQAKLGIAHLVGAHPSKLQHCDACTGGGFWKAWFPT